MPKEVNDEENIVIQTVNRFGLLNNYCYFELGYILKIVIYPSLFNVTLSLSRIIDVEPSLLFKGRILEAQRRLTQVMVPLEILSKHRDTDESYHEYTQ